MRDAIINRLSNRIIDSIKRNNYLKRSLYSLILYGSIVRCDYIPRISDIDFFAVITNEKIIPNLKDILEDSCRDMDAYEVDLAWERLENIEDPLVKGYPYKFLTIYQKDFIENHLVIYGREIVHLIPRYNWRNLIKWRCRFLIKHAEKNMENRKMMHIIAGETIRLQTWIKTERLDKHTVLRTLEEAGDHEGLSIYKAYLNNRSEAYTSQYLYKFIKNRLNTILNGSY